MNCFIDTKFWPLVKTPKGRHQLSQYKCRTLEKLTPRTWRRLWIIYPLRNNLNNKMDLHGSQSHYTIQNILKTKCMTSRILPKLKQPPNWLIICVKNKEWETGGWSKKFMAKKWYVCFFSNYGKTSWIFELFKFAITSYHPSAMCPLRPKIYFSDAICSSV